MKEQPDLKRFVLQHRYAGGGLVFIDELGNDYCRVATFGRDSISEIKDRCFVAWKKLLSPQIENPTIKDSPLWKVPEELAKSVEEIRNKIAYNVLTVRNTHFCKP